MTGCAASSERCRKRNPMWARFRAAAGDHAGRSLRVRSGIDSRTPDGRSAPRRSWTSFTSSSTAS